MGISLITSTLLIANATVVEKASKAGLKAIPTDTTALKKLIDPKGELSDEKVALGKQLFFEPRLSKSGIISCNSCHNLGLGGVNGVAAAVGHKMDCEPSSS